MTFGKIDISARTGQKAELAQGRWSRKLGTKECSVPGLQGKWSERREPWLTQLQLRERRAAHYTPFQFLAAHCFKTFFGFNLCNLQSSVRPQPRPNSQSPIFGTMSQEPTCQTGAFTPHPFMSPESEYCEQKNYREVGGRGVKVVYQVGPIGNGEGTRNCSTPFLYLHCQGK